MSMLLWLLIIRYLITKISSEIFTIGLGLCTIRSPSENNSGCFLLQQQAGDSWWSGGFHNCISNPPISFGLAWQIIPFRISVDSNIFYDYPESGRDVEQYAFINKELNAPGKQCLTVTGSNWWIEQVVHNLTYVIRMFYHSPLGNLNTSVCSKLAKSRSAAYNLIGNLTCESDMIYYTGLQMNIHAVRLRIQGNLNGISLDMMSNVEIALRVEALFNIDKIGCITFEPGHTVKLKMGASFYTFYKSCVQERKQFVLPPENRQSSYRLEANEPFYEIDEVLYLERHAQLVHNLNKPYLSCEYNGYIQMEQCRR